MIVGFLITSQVPSSFPLARKIESNKIHGHAILSNLLGYDFLTRYGDVADHVSKATKLQALSVVRDIFVIY